MSRTLGLAVTAALVAAPVPVATEIVEAGRPTEIARSGAGQLLVSYLVESDDDEGPQASA